MRVSFELTMPNVGSWNGKWTGAANKYYVIINYKSAGEQKRIKELLEDRPSRSFYYGWSDGWGASVNMEIVDAIEARRRIKMSAGFCGYNWMIDSIIDYGKILDSEQKKEEVSQ